MIRWRALVLTAFATVSFSACATPRAEAPQPARGIPGFDTRDYPGDDGMRAWFGASPYRWVGYYLPAPCYKGTTWAGRRESLRDIGWGFAVLFVGEQDWSAMANVQADTAAVEQPQCSSAHLTPERAATHADEAVRAASEDGFPIGTVIFLDVERVDDVSPELLTYVRSWVARMLEAESYTPGIYTHDVNVEALYPMVAEEFVRAGRSGRPPLWVARPADFDIRSSPRESGYAAASIWQGVLNTREDYRGVRLNIDVNVSDSADPSRGR